jgi:regulator of sigma E protease
MSLLITIAAFLLAIGILVTFHELGHYWAARLCDVRILRFSIGFGRPLLLRRFGPDQTEWVIAALPLGGFVRMADERDGSAGATDGPRAFNNKTALQRIFIVIAGPLANFVLAIFFYWVLFVSGVPGAKPYLAQPAPGTAAAVAGFAEFDLVTRIDGSEVRTWGDARLALLDAAVKGETVEIEVEESAGHRSIKRLGTERLDKADLDKDFLAKLGLGAYRLMVDPVLDAVMPDGAAARGGLRAGDRITAAAGRQIARWQELVEVISNHPAEALPLSVMRDGEAIALSVTPDRVSENGRSFGRIGITPRVDRALEARLNTVVRYGPVDSVGRSLRRVWEMSAFSIKMMGRMLSGDISWKNLSGPLTIADYAGQSAQMGWVPYLTFLALISISLGVLNLLPIPVLDGGQLMYYMAELLTGKPVSERVMEIGQQVGLTLLLGLTAFAFYNDIHRLVAG